MFIWYIVYIALHCVDDNDCKYGFLVEFSLTEWILFMFSLPIFGLQSMDTPSLIIISLDCSNRMRGDYIP